MNQNKTNPSREPVYDTVPLHVQPSIEHIQPIRVPRRRQASPGGCCGCTMTLLVPIFVAFLLLAGYFFFPQQTNLLILGIDRTPDGSAVGRSDTIILTSVDPLLPRVAMLSIPRDLWVSIPGVGENRINTAHFFAEANQPGTGPQAALDTVQQNFGVRVPYFVRVRFDTIVRVVDSLGGVTVSLPEDMAGLPAGTHHLDGAQTLAFIRDRSGTDDFYRMEHSQFMVRALVRQLLMPTSWPSLPQAMGAGFDSIDTNLPIWQWPRLGLAMIRASLTGIDSRTIRREMTTPFVTDGGAQVLLPDWASIAPMIEEMFGQ